MIRSSKSHTAEQFCHCGTKAYHLAKLQKAGFCVPAFLCIGKEDLQAAAEIDAMLKKEGIKPPYSVRSSAQKEDQENTSYAGQFKTFLYVPEDKLLCRVKECFQSAQEEKLLYGRKQAEGKGKIHVIIQQMVNAELSGIMFTENPMGILSEMVTVVGAGIGARVVEDQVPTTTYYDNLPDEISYFIKQPGAPELPSEIRKALRDSKPLLEANFGEGLDIEYAVAEGKLYFLQVRKITTLAHKKRIVLDNSNIVESYPGITLPLTACFVTKQYANIFEGVMTRLSGNKKIAREYKNIFSHMVEHYNGRMYYQINHWYGVIGFLPFSKRIVPLWQEMLGVKPGEAAISVFSVSFTQKIAVAVHTLYYFFRAPAKMEALSEAFFQIEKEFQSLEMQRMTLRQLYDFYKKMEWQVMEKWDYTLINDMYTFLYIGIFRWLWRQQGICEEGIKQAIADISQLASLQPIKAILLLAAERKKNGESPRFQRDFQAYLEKYGDRSIGELKLETETFRECPRRLREQIKKYEELPKLEMLLEQMDQLGQGASLSGISGFFLTHAKKGIENRECARMNRTRLFGFARAIFLQAGKLLQQQKRLETERDVFYLTMDEIFCEKTTSYHSIVEKRKYVMKSYEHYPMFSRIVFDGNVVQKPCLEGALQQETSGADILQGTPCSSGKVTGSILLINDPQEAAEADGKILVTRSTDPGWAFLLTAAKGLISEKGSLLSHTAIIARELHIPMVVAVPNAMAKLKSGEIVELDCETGLIRRIEETKKNKKI